MASVRDGLTAPSIAHDAHKLPSDMSTTMRELYPAGMKDLQMWNRREMRLCLEWAKTFPAFTVLSLNDQYALLRNFAWSFNLLNRAYYSPDHGPDKIVFMNGAYILRQPQEQLQLPGFRTVYHRQMDEIMNPLRQLHISMAEFAAYKAAIFFNPDAIDLSRPVKSSVSSERSKYLYALFGLMTQKYGIPLGAQKYGQLLMMTSSIQNIISQTEENLQVFDVFKNWQIDSFVKELSMKDP